MSRLAQAAPDVDGIRIAAESPQLRVNNGHAYLGDPTPLGANLDRLVHAAPRIAFEGGLRKVWTAPVAADERSLPRGGTSPPGEATAIQRHEAQSISRQGRAGFARFDPFSKYGRITNVVSDAGLIQAEPAAVSSSGQRFKEAVGW